MLGPYFSKYRDTTPGPSYRQKLCNISRQWTSVFETNSPFSGFTVGTKRVNIQPYYFFEMYVGTRQHF